MLTNFRRYWKEYLMEAWGLGTFMVSAVLFTILLEHNDFFLKKELIDIPFLRRLIIGIAMGLTAIGIMYSPWGKRSGAHLNPAVTLSFWRLGKINKYNAFFYIIFQFIGGYLGVLLFQIFFNSYTNVPEVNYAITVPGKTGIYVAFFFEAFLSFVLFMTVLIASNNRKLAKLTPILAGIWLTFFIAFEAPFSGMSINPARTIASAVPADIWTNTWLYFVAPPLGMLMATETYLKLTKTTKEKIKCHLTCEGEKCTTHIDNIK